MHVSVFSLMNVAVLVSAMAGSAAAQDAQARCTSTISDLSKDSCLQQVVAKVDRSNLLQSIRDMTQTACADQCRVPMQNAVKAIVDGCTPLVVQQVSKMGAQLPQGADVVVGSMIGNVLNFSKDAMCMRSPAPTAGGRLCSIEMLDLMQKYKVVTRASIGDLRLGNLNLPESDFNAAAFNDIPREEKCSPCVAALTSQTYTFVKSKLAPVLNVMRNSTGDMVMLQADLVVGSINGACGQDFTKKDAPLTLGQASEQTKGTSAAEALHASLEGVLAAVAALAVAAA